MKYLQRLCGAIFTRVLQMLCSEEPQCDNMGAYPSLRCLYLPLVGPKCRCCDMPGRLHGAVPAATIQFQKEACMQCG